MTITFGFLYLLVGFEDVMFILGVTITYLLILYLQRQQRPREIFVPSTNCDICGKPRAKEDLMFIGDSRNFSTGHVEWNREVCKDNKECINMAKHQVAQYLSDEEVRRNGK